MLLKVKKIIAGAMITAIIATGTIASGSAATTLYTENSFKVQQKQTVAFTLYNSKYGDIVSALSSYPTIYGNYNYSKGTTYVQHTTRGTKRTRDYYLMENVSSPTTIDYGDYYSGNFTLSWTNTAGGGFSGNLEVFVY